MNLVSLFSEDIHLKDLLSSQIALDYLISPSKIAFINQQALDGLEPLGFSGAMVLGESLQSQAFKHVQRHSLAAQRVAAVDTIIVTPMGLMGDYSIAYAIGKQLDEKKWSAVGARIVIVGNDARAIATANELASMGAQHITVIAQEQPFAEHVLRNIAITTQKLATTPGQIMAGSSLERADLLIRFDHGIEIDSMSLGPHLNIIDLSPNPYSVLRQDANKMGAETISDKDIQAYHLATMLELILARDVSVDYFLDILHR